MHQASPYQSFDFLFYTLTFNFSTNNGTNLFMCNIFVSRQLSYAISFGYVSFMGFISNANFLQKLLPWFWDRRLGDECQPFDQTPPSEPLFDPKNVVIVSNGRYGPRHGLLRLLSWVFVVQTLWNSNPFFISLSLDAPARVRSSL